tara:strand:+ start:623 stop:2485 length:1863 start_codon:yes stop_codon:yes gene_type:complete
MQCVIAQKLAELQETSGIDKDASEHCSRAEASRILNIIGEIVVTCTTLHNEDGEPILSSDATNDHQLVATIYRLKQFAKIILLCDQKRTTRTLTYNRLQTTPFLLGNMCRMHSIPSDYIKDTGNSAFMKMINNEAAARELRHDGTSIFKEATDTDDTGKVFGTYVWLRCGDLEDFIRETLNPCHMPRVLEQELYRKDWVGTMLLTIRGADKNARFPRLEQAGSLTSCRSGLYCRDLLVFYEFGQEEDWPRLNAAANVRLKNRGVPCPTKTSVALHYHKKCIVSAEVIAELNKTPDIADIGVAGLDVPNLASILRYQGHDDESIDSFLVLLGRCLYPLNEHDAWRTMLAVVGTAGTGKSVILQILSHAFAPSDVFVISMQTEKSFGLEGASKCKLAVIPELKEELTARLEEKTIHAMLNADNITVQQKGKGNLDVEWRLPMIAAGNNVISLTDAASNKAPITLIPFDTRVTKQDPALCSRIIHEEFLSFIMRATILYRQRAMQHGDDCVVETVYSPQMRTYHEKTLRRTNALYDFISEHCEKTEDETLFVQKIVFTFRLQEWLKEENRLKIDSPKVQAYLLAEGFEPYQRTTTDADGKRSMEMVVRGLCMKTNQEEEHDGF